MNVFVRICKYYSRETASFSLEFQKQLENVSQKTFGRGADTFSAVVSDWELIHQGRGARGTGSLPKQILEKSLRVGNYMVLRLNQFIQCQE